MDGANFDFYCGVFKCCIGVVLILSGIIGWPATRFILGLIAYPFTHREPQKPVGSPFWDKVDVPEVKRQSPTNASHPISQAAPFWNKYKDPNWMRRERGFALAPILYLLGLIGVTSGVLFSGYSQTLRTGQAVQNSMMVRSDMQAAANTLSAQAVFGTNGLTLCPPRSIHQSNGDPCAAAPVSLVQFADFTGTQFPANYANAGMTGSPVEVGVFAAGSGVKVLDAYGHTYIYCRWENSSSSSASPAFVLLSAGANGNLQTRCGDTAAQGDDGYLMVTVGAAINHAALWQTVGTSTVGYGATGTQVTVDSSGNINAAGNISAQNAAISNAITAGTLTTSGNISANTLSTNGNITSSATVIGTSGEFANLSGGNLNISGEATIIGTSFLGNLSAGASTLNSLNVTNNAAIGGGITIQGDATVIGTSTLGNLSAEASMLNSLTVTNGATLNNGLSINNGDLDLANGYSYAQLDSTGVARRLIALSPTNDVLLGGHNGTNYIYFLAGNAEVGWFDTSGDFTATGNITGANGSFGNLSAVATTLTGNLTGTNATFSGTVTASSFVGNLNLGASGSSISGIVPLANGGTGYATSSVSNLLNNLFGNDTAPAITIPVARLPALSGDVTHAAGSSTTSIAAIQGTAITGVTGSGNAVLSASPTITGTLSAANAYFLGYVGIGTISPTQPLQIGSIGGPNTLFTGGRIQLTSTNATTPDMTINSTGGADGLRIQNDGTDTFAVKATGNVGIGTPSPDGTLEIYSIYPAIDLVSSQNSQREYQFINDGNFAFIKDNSDAAGEFRIRSNTNTDVARFSFAAPSNSFNLSSSGDIGIGTTSPINPLDVNGGAVIGNGYAGTYTAPTNGLLVQGNVAIGATSTTHTLAVAGSAWAWNFVTNQGAGAYWANTGSTAASPAYYINNGGGMFSPATNSLAFSTNSNEQMRITSTGAVGIGTTNPAYTLDVYGKMRVDSGLFVLGNTGGVNRLQYGTSSGGAFQFVNSGDSLLMTISASNGTVGIGTVAPQATLDINGFMRLAKNSSQPASCASDNDGAIALTAVYTLCVCKNGTGWVTEATGSTSCTW